MGLCSQAFGNKVNMQTKPLKRMLISQDQGGQAFSIHRSAEGANVIEPALLAFGQWGVICVCHGTTPVMVERQGAGEISGGIGCGSFGAYEER